MLDPVLYQRFISEGRGLLPSDVYEAIAQVLSDLLPGESRRQRQARQLRDAATLLPETMKRWPKAEAIHAELIALRRVAMPSQIEAGTLRGVLLEVLRGCEKTPSVRTIYRALLVRTD